MAKHKVTMIDPKNTSSFIATTIEPPKIRKSRGGKWYVDYDAHVTMSDCNKTIRWELIKYSNRYGDSAGFDVDKAYEIARVLNNMADELVKYHGDYVDLAETVKLHNDKLPKKKGKTLTSALDDLDL